MAKWMAVCCWAALLLTCAGCLSPASKRTRYSFQPGYGAEDPQFLRSMQALGTGTRAGNQVKLLENGDGFFPNLFAALREARESINIESYIFDDGKVGRELTDILCERAQAGVEVRMLVDAIGSRAPLLAARMRQAGVKFRNYKPIRLYALYHIEDRTHRKLVVVDGRTGFIGGFCFHDYWLGNGTNRNEWRELNLRVDGPAVAQMQMIFLQDWLHTAGEVLHGDKQFPAIDMPGDKLVQAIASSHKDQASMSKLMVYMAIQAARKRIYIANAYFVPDSQIRTALIQAAKRGVDVRIVVPGPNIDIALVRHASRYHQQEFIKNGVKIYEYQPTMLHSKAMVVDGVWTSIGSININARSFKKNAEANMVVYDYAFATEVEKAIERDIALSEAITIEECKQRGPCARMMEFWASLFSERY